MSFQTPKKVTIQQRKIKDLGVDKTDTRVFPKEKSEVLVIEYKQTGVKKCPIPRLLIPGALYTMGDLHGNAINLLSFLVEEGFLDLTANLTKEPLPYPDLFIIFAEELHRDANGQTLNEAIKKTMVEGYLKNKETLRNLLYDKLVAIYETEPFTKKNKLIYDLIIKNSKINTGAAISLIGDEFGDRGNNDYFTLKLLEKLQPLDKLQPRVPLEIIISNHGIEFLRMRDLGYPKEFTTLFRNRYYGRSAEFLAYYVNQGIIPMTEVNRMVEACYIPFLKITSAVIEGNHIETRTHSLTGEKTREALAKKLNVPYFNRTPKEVADSIDRLNATVQVLLKTKTRYGNNLLISQFLALYLEEKDEIKKRKKKAVADYKAMMNSRGVPPIPQEIRNIKDRFLPENVSIEFPITRMIWHRFNYDNPSKEDVEEIVQNHPQGFQNSYVHGHDGTGTVLSNHLDYVSNTDHESGKLNVSTPGYYTVHITKRGLQQRLAKIAAATAISAKEDTPVSAVAAASVNLPSAAKVTASERDIKTAADAKNPAAAIQIHKETPKKTTPPVLGSNVKSTVAPKAALPKPPHITAPPVLSGFTAQETIHEKILFGVNDLEDSHRNEHLIFLIFKNAKKANDFVNLLPNNFNKGKDYFLKENARVVGIRKEQYTNIKSYLAAHPLLRKVAQTLPELKEIKFKGSGGFTPS